VVGIKKYQELQPDVVTVDITMPEITGIDVLKEIKKFDPEKLLWYLQWDRK